MHEEIFKSLFEIVGFFNRPRQDRVLMQKAGVELDTALFPLLVRIGMLGPVGVVELAEHVHRDHSTVSRQVDKVIALGLATSKNGVPDRRVRKIALSASGRAALKKIVDARRILMKEALKDWKESELATMRTTLEHLTETLRANAAP